MIILGATYSISKCLAMSGQTSLVAFAKTDDQMYNTREWWSSRHPGDSNLNLQCSSPGCHPLDYPVYPIIRYVHNSIQTFTYHHVLKIKLLFYSTNNRLILKI